MNKPAYNLPSKNKSHETCSNASRFDHSRLLRHAQEGNTKDRLFQKESEGASRRDIASEIDYSDQKSIASSLGISKRQIKRPSDTQSVLSKSNLAKLNGEQKQGSSIRKCGLYNRWLNLLLI